MSVADEIKQDAVRTGALLGAVVSFAVLFYLYTISTWLLVLVLLVGAAGFVAFRYMRY